MGRGEGGGKSGGGGRGTRGDRAAAGGGGSAYDNQHLEPSKAAMEKNIDAPLSAYKDLPEIANNNRFIDAEGRVIVGTKGAPKPPPKLSPSEAYDVLKATGAPEKYRMDIASLGDDALSDVAGLVKGWSWEGGGAEGAVWSKGSKVRRVQINGLEPLPHYNIGKIGAYPEWKQKYGTTDSRVWVEQKPRMWKTARAAGHAYDSFFERAKAGLKHKAQKVDKRITNFNDAHPGNIAFDSKGRPRIIDPGAAVPAGASILAGW